MAEKFTPKKYQLEAIKFMVSRGAAGLFLDPGLGKTICTLLAFEILRSKGIVRRLLVVSELRPAYLVWPKEIEKWGLKLKCVVVHGSKKRALLQSKADVFVINYEGLAWLRQQMDDKRLREKLGFDMLALDESGNIRNTRTKRFKMLKTMLNWFRRRYILTGTPAPKGLLNLFGQVYALDQGAALGRYITQFRLEYFYQTGFMGYDWEPQPDAEKRIFKKLKPLILRLSRDLLNLPKISHPIIRVQLPKKARKIYNEMEKELIAKIKRREVLASNSAVASGKCRQIANGGVYDNSKRAIHVHDAKTEAVLELVRELEGQPVIIVYEFDHDLQRLKAAFGKNVPAIIGGLSGAKLAQLEADWNAGKIPVLLSIPHKGSNLQAGGSNMIWYSQIWDLDKYEQMYQRLWRQGQKYPVMNYHIIAEDTVDEDVMKSLRKKSKTQQSILQAFERRVRK